MRYTFPKTEKLCSHNIISELFSKGSSFVCFPFRVVYLTTPLTEDTSSQVIFSVSKKRFKRAVHRNKIKRQCREAYRLNRMDFSDYLINTKQQIAFAMVYISGEQLSYHTIEKGMKKSLQKLINSLEPENNA